MKSILKKKSYAPIKEGEYEVKLLTVEEIEGKEGKDNYISTKYEFVEEGRRGQTITVNSFGNGIDVYFNQLRQTLEVKDGVYSYEELINMTEGRILKLFITKTMALTKEGELKEFTNYSLVKPREENKVKYEEVK